ncbi:methyl-accepting chemotaxis protein [Methylobacterium oryzisoli]|uniref:methyl-accepting chemotaxis protein n=1 Tax=Methylobacterium oryzisoli TaxID=3385502 RepID=UPI003891EA82
MFGKFAVVRHRASAEAGTRSKTSASRQELEAKLAALDKSLATIEFATDGTILDANSNFLQAVGYDLDEIRGKHHALFVDPAEAASTTYKEFWASLQRGQFQAAEYKRFGKGGREIWIQATYNPVLDAAGTPVKVVKFATDITAQKMRGADLNGQVAAINKSQAVIHFAMDGTILDVNDNFLRTVGYDREEVVGQHHALFVDPEEARGWDYASFWQKLNKGQHQTAEFRRYGKDGREIWLQASYNPILDLNGKPFKVVKYATDVTADKLRNADHAGQISAINQSQAVIHFAMDGTILDANDNFLDAMGYRLAEIQGQHHQMFVERAYAASREYQEFWQKLRRGEFHSAIYSRLGKNGREVFIQATYNPICDMSGRPFKVVKYATDITENMRARTQAIGAAEQTLMNVQTVASAAEEMNASVREITGAMSRSKQAVDLIHGHTLAADRSTAQLRRAAEAMDGVVQLITKTAEQINLLSLNATIESMRAGEAGKGFAVVASEVKTLANQTTAATGKISEQIGAMQAVSTEVVETLAAISTQIGSVQGFVTGAASAIEQQSAVTQEITASMQTAASGVENITRSLAAWR